MPSPIVRTTLVLSLTLLIGASAIALPQDEGDCGPPLVATPTGPDLAKVKVALSTEVQEKLRRRQFSAPLFVDALRAAPTPLHGVESENGVRFAVTLQVEQAGFGEWSVDLLWHAAENRILVVSVWGEKRLPEAKTVGKRRSVVTLPTTKVNLTATERMIARLARLDISPEDVEHAILHPLSASIRHEVAGERWLVGETADGRFLTITYEIHSNARELRFVSITNEEAMRSFLTKSPPVFEDGAPQIHVDSGPFANKKISYMRGREKGIEWLYELDRSDVEEAFLLSRGGVSVKPDAKQKWFLVRLRPSCNVKIVYDILRDGRITVRTASRTDHGFAEYEKMLLQNASGD